MRMYSVDEFHRLAGNRRRSASSVVPYAMHEAGDKEIMDPYLRACFGPRSKTEFRTRNEVETMKIIHDGVVAYTRVGVCVFERMKWRRKRPLT